jgi:hypothetical protein
MPDNDLQINVATKADLSGLQALRAEVSGINSDIAAQLTAAGARFDPITHSYKSISDAAKETNTEVSQLPKFLEIGRFQAAALSRELVDGAFNARTIGVSLASFGPAVAVTGIALFTVVEALINVNKEQDKWLEGVLKTTAEVDKLQQSILAAQDTLRETALITSLPLGAGIRAAQQDVERLKTEQSLVTLQTKEGLEEYKKYTGEIAKAQSLVDELTKKQQHQTDIVQQTTDQIALNRAYGDEELTIQLKVQKIYDAKLASLKEAHVPEALAKDLASETAESERQRLEAMRGMAAPANTLNDFLKQTATILQNIRQQQELVKGAPFMGADEKSAALLGQQLSELNQVNTAITNLSRIRGGLTDPIEIDKANQEMQKLVFTAQQLGQKIAAAVQPLRSELTHWANSFGTTMHQVATTIEQTVGVALQGLNQWIVTGKFNLQSMLQQVEMLGLQLIEQLILQRVMSAINASLGVTQAETTAPLVAQAWGPAATAVSVATEGQADTTAPGAFAIALGSIQGMLVHAGGEIGDAALRKFHRGGLAADEEHSILQHGEIVINRDVAQRHRNFLLGLNAKRFHKGGEEGPGAWNNWVTSADTPMTAGTPGHGPMGPLDTPYSYTDPTIEPTPIPYTPGDPTFDPGPPVYGTGPDTPPAPFDPGPIYGQGPEQAAKTQAWDQGWSTSDFPAGWFNQFGPTYFDPSGQNPFGPTMIPTFWDPQGFPMGVPMDSGLQLGTSGVSEEFQHSGGEIGGIGSFSLPSVQRFHTGGVVSGLSGSRISGSGAGASGQIRGGGSIHIHNYTDLKTLVKELATREGRKIIVDTVRGNRIDLGI